VPDLNKEQEEAAQFLEGIAAVIAVPGSGKTRTMMERIGKLVKLHDVAPESILGLTFTRNAAEEMRSRLVPVLGELASRVMLSTIHSFCFWLLKSEGTAFQVLTGKEQLAFLRDALKQLKAKSLSVGSVLQQISLAKSNLISADEFRSLYEGDKTMLKVADAYELYDAQKKKKLLLDFDDLLLETYRLLNQHEEIRSRYVERFTHILVDEFQDTNPIQLEILKSMSKATLGSSFWVTGDDYQSIYSFTGASVGNILNFGKTFEGARIFILNLNYRSTPQILHACQNLISHNKRRIEKTLVTNNPDGERITVLESSNEETEAINIVTEIQDLISRKGYSHKNIAVLYRCNFQSRVLEEIFSRFKVPYQIQGGLGFYQRTEVRVLLDYLRLIVNPNSEAGDEAFLSVINVPNRYIGKKFISELQEFAQMKGFRLYQALKSMPVDVPYLRKFIREFLKLMDPVVNKREEQEPTEVIDLLRNSLDYDRAITDEDVPSPDDFKIQNINQLQLSATRFKDIPSFLEYADSFQDESSNDREGVHLMTIHKAKGLEFSAVFIPGLVETVCPTKKGDLEEERRIAFVACSRAMKLLYLSYSLNYLGIPAKKSIFIDEMMGAK
jgi:DNA helicase-2/ATP-dependent DNA helicase PcrA